MKESKYAVIDFDNTVADTSRAIIEMLSEKTNREILYESSAIQWNFKPYIQNEEEWKFCMSCFESEEMYNRANIIDEANLRDFLNSSEYQTVLCSYRRPKTYDLCRNFLEKHKLKFDHIVFTDSFDKSLIASGNDSIIIDDKYECLTGNRGTRILFGNYGYQDKFHESIFCETEEYIHKATDWSSVKHIIDNLIVSHEENNVQ